MMSVYVANYMMYVGRYRKSMMYVYVASFMMPVGH